MEFLLNSKLNRNGITRFTKQPQFFPVIKMFHVSLFIFRFQSSSYNTHKVMARHRLNHAKDSFSPPKDLELKKIRSIYIYVFLDIGRQEKLP